MFFLLMPSLVFAQIITSSFDNSILSRNPSAATTRVLSQLVLFHTYNHSTSDITQERAPGQTSSWSEEIKFNKSGVYVTSHGNFSPELYLSSDSAQKSLELNEANGQLQETTMSMINNMVNLGFRLTRNFSFGVKYFSPSYEYKEDYTIEYNDSQTISFDSVRKYKMTGMGAGLNYQFAPDWFLGGYYISMKLKAKEVSTYVDSNGDNSSQSFDGEQSQKQYGGGVSYSNRKMRFEFAYSAMILDTDYDMPEGKELYGALEFYARRFTFGVNIKQRKNIFFDNIEILDYVIGSRTFSESYIPTYGAFLTFGTSKGFTFGLSGLMYKLNGMKKIFGEEQKASTTFQSLNFDLGYLF